MFKKRSVHKNGAPGLPGHAGDFFSFFNRPFIPAFLAFTILGILFSILIYQRYELLKETKRKEGLDIANNVKDKLQESLEHSLSAAKVLSFFIDKKGDVKDFDSVASEILSANNDIDALQLMPAGVTKYVYPVNGNDSAIGYNVLEDPLRNKEAYKAIEKKEMFFTGPFKLKQGGMAVVGRLPVFRNNKFWGFSSVVIKMPTLFKAAGINSTSHKGYFFLLSKINPDTKKENFFLTEHRKQYKNLSVSLNVPNGEWKLYVIRESEYEGFGDIILLALLGALLSVLGAVFIFSVAMRPKKLDELVKERTRKLKESENKYRSLIERVSDAFVSLDNNWNYTYLNKKAGELLGKNPEKLVGENIWVEFPQGIDQAYYHAYHRAMESQMYQYTEEYYALSDKWFENHIYPSKDGLTIFFTDVTDIKKVTLALKENEEKYRSLIEQASDGIVITDLDGYIQEVNNSICTMSGYSAEETLGMHLYKFLPVEDTALNPFKFKELLEGKSLLYEGRLLKKDGTILEIEVNSRMASTHTLIGFIRDITERRKNEETLRYQARLLEAVSDAVTSVDMNRCIISWNRSCEELYGFTKEEVMGKRIPELVTFEFPGSTSDEVFKQVFSEGLWKGEFNFIHPQTKIRTHLLSSINLVKSKQGNITGFIITSKDITDRKKAEEKLKKREAQLSASIENTPNVAVQWYNDKGKILYWNHASELLYGWTSDEATGKTLDQLSFSPEEAADFLKNLEKVDKTGKIIGPAEYEFRRRDGSVGYCIGTAFSIPSDEEGLCFVCMDVDITELKKAEETLVEKEKRIQQILSSTADNFYVIDPDYTVVLINKVAERNLQIAWGKSIKPGTNLLAVIPDTAEPIKENFEKAFGGESIEYEMHHTHPDLPTWVLVRITPVINESGIIIAVTVVAEDISERKAAEVLIRESETKYRIMIEQASDGIFFANSDAYFIDVNSAGCKMLGYTKEELYTMKFPSLIPPEDQANNPVKFAQLKTGDTIINERRLIRKDGSLIDVEISAKILFDGRYQSIVRDITERKKTAEEIINSKRQFQNLVENISGVYWVNNLETYETLYISPSYETIWGSPCEELYKNPADFINAVHPEDKDLVLEAHKNIANTYKNNLSYRIIRPDGEIRWISANTNVVIGADGKKIEYGYAEDITERKQAEEKLLQSEEKYRLLFYNNPIPMWMATVPELDIIDVNESAIKQYGYTRKAFLKLNARDLRPAEDIEEFYEKVNKMKSDVINTMVWRQMKKDGTIIHAETYSHQIMYEGRLVWLGLSHDVTEKYKARELLQKSYEEIRQLASNLQSIREDERTNIAREIHDELGQQLTGLKMDMHWLSRKINNADEEVNKKMNESIQLINATITSVRKIATDLRPSILDDLGLMAALEWQSEEFEKRSGTKVKFINNAGDITVLPEVATALFRIYQELLTNIARHANASQVTASLYIVDRNLCFSIADNGVGFNLDTINKKKTLGILGIKERTLLIGGTYEIKTRPGQGSETIISVPLYLVKNTD